MNPTSISARFCSALTNIFHSLGESSGSSNPVTQLWELSCLPRCGCQLPLSHPDSTSQAVQDWKCPVSANVAQSVIHLSIWVNHRSMRLPFRISIVPLPTISAPVVSESSIHWASVCLLSNRSGPIRHVPGRYLPVWLILWHPNSVMAYSLEVLSHTKGARRHYSSAFWLHSPEQCLYGLGGNQSLLTLTQCA